MAKRKKKPGSEFEHLLAQQLAVVNSQTNRPYSLEELRAAGLVAEPLGIVDDFTSTVNCSNLAMARKTLGRWCRKIIRNRSWSDLDPDYLGLTIRAKRDRDLAAALTIRGVLNLVDLHHQRGEVEAMVDRLVQALAMRVSQEGLELSGFIPTGTQLANRKRRQISDKKAEAARTEFQRRRKANPKLTKRSALFAMAKECNGNGKPKWGGLRKLQDYCKGLE